VKKFFAQLRPLERRLAVGVLVVLYSGAELGFHLAALFGLEQLRQPLRARRSRKLKLYQTALRSRLNYEAQVKNLESQGEFVAPEDQAINFMRTIRRRPRPAASA
jgi:hypothetical protein